MSFTPQDVIDAARVPLNDTDSSGYRYETTDLLRLVNDALKQLALIRPDLFSTIGDFECVAGQCEQLISFEDATALIEVLCIHNGAALTPFDMDALNAFNPAWRTDTAGAAVQWAQRPGDPLRFFIYPKAPASQTLDVRYGVVPSDYALTDLIQLSPAYKPALVDYVVGMAEAVDDEHVNSGRSTQFLNQFAARVGK